MATATKKQLTETQRAFLENPFVATVTTLRADGSPHATVVWIDVDDAGPSFNTAIGRTKERNLRRDARLALLVVDPEDPYRWLAIDGRAELTTDGADAQIDRLAKKYLGEDEYPWRDREQTRVTVRIHPDRLEGYDLD
jgi:PPOX class probable F420-dependent enzyme